MGFPLWSRMPRWLARVGVPDPRVGVCVVVFSVTVVVLALARLAGVDSGEVLGWAVLAGMVSADVVRRWFGQGPGAVGAAVPAGGR